MFTTIEHEGKQVPAVIFLRESEESVMSMRQELLEVLSTVATSVTATSNLSSMTLYSILNLHRHMGEDVEPEPPKNGLVPED